VKPEVLNLAYLMAPNASDPYLSAEALISRPSWAIKRVLQRGRFNRVLSWTGSLCLAGPGHLRELCGQPRVPQLRDGEVSPRGHLGRNVGEAAPFAASSIRLRGIP